MDMKRILSVALALCLLAACTAAGMGESLFVDNRETDKVYPERLNMRAEPEAGGGLLGLYYTGAEVTVLGEENGYTKVSVGGVEGYMSSEYLITAQEAASRYGEGSAFGKGREAQVDLSGLWKTSTQLREGAGDKSKALLELKTGDAVEILGILETQWAYVAVQTDAQRMLGYIPLDELTDVGGRRVLVVAGDRADSQTNLYAYPANNAEKVLSLKNGTACFSVFGRTVGQWRKVRVGGEVGWIKASQTDNLVELGAQARGTIPYYPLLMQTKNDALLYSVKGDSSARYMTLGRDMKVEVLAESGDYVYVRTLEGGVGATDSGDYGYMEIKDLTLAAAGESIGVVKMDNGDLPGVLLEEPQADAAVLGAVCAGAQVRLVAYTQTDYVQVELDGLTGYLPKREICMIGSADESVSERIPQRAVARQELSLLQKPEDGAKAEETVPAGSRVYMLGICGDWAYVRCGDTPWLDVQDASADGTGFVPVSALNAPASTLYLTAKVTQDKVNMRSKPSMDGPIIGKARLDELLRVADYGTQWTCVVRPDGTRGYVMTTYLTFE